MGVINMAHGEMVMLGAYSHLHRAEPAAARASRNGRSRSRLPLAFLVAGCVGMLIERLVIRFLYGRPLETLLATWGVSLILQQLVRTIFGANNRQVSAPAFMSGSIEVGGLSITTGRLWIIVLADRRLRRAAVACCAPRPFGLRMRAVTQNRRMAVGDGHFDRPHRHARLRSRLGHRRHRRRRAFADRQRLAQSRPGLHHRQLHGRGARRRRQSLGHAARRADARRRQQAARAVRSARCSARSCCWSSSSCSSRSGRAACSRSRAGRWRHERLSLLAARSAGPRLSSSSCSASAILVPMLALAVPQGLGVRDAALCRRAARQISLLRDARPRARSGLGLLRHSLARPWRVLRARRLCDGHVSDAPDRRARRLRQSDPARFHGVPELEGTADPLVGLQFLPLCDGRW